MFAFLALTAMIRSGYCCVAMAKQATPKRGVTPPKGRPTRSRSGVYRNKRVFGPVAQWIGVVVLLLMLFVVLIIATGGGDFNPFNNDGSQTGGAGYTSLTAIAPVS